MPTYAYRCTTCAHEFDIAQRFADAPITECPVCSGVVRRVFQPVGVVFKGSGWYINDSRTKTATASSATAESGKKSDSKSSSSDTGSESKGSSDKGSEKSAPAAVKDSSSKTAKSAAD